MLFFVRHTFDRDGGNITSAGYTTTTLKKVKLYSRKWYYCLFWLCKIS